jgi:hypothetical protein
MGARRRQVRLENLARCRPGLDDRDALARKRERGFLRRRHIEPDRERECRTGARLAVDGQPAAHQLDEARRDRKAEAGSAETARRRRVGLAEGLEQTSDGLGIETDPGVPDGKAQGAGFGVRGRRDLDRDLALLGELDGIADQIEQDLPEPDRIAQDDGRHAGIDPRRKLEALAPRLGGQRLDDALDDRARHDLDALEIEPAGFYFREIQDVVDDLQQR